MVYLNVWSLTMGLNSEFQDFMKVNGIKHQLTPPYHPASNGQAERMVQVFKKSMEGRPSGRSIQHQISLLLLRYRTTPNITTGKTPAELLMKRNLRTRLSLIQPMEGQNVRERQEDQIAATAGNREMMPGKSVAIWNPRQQTYIHTYIYIYRPIIIYSNNY